MLFPQSPTNKMHQEDILEITNLSSSISQNNKMKLKKNFLGRLRWMIFGCVFFLLVLNFTVLTKGVDKTKSIIRESLRLRSNSVSKNSVRADSIPFCFASGSNISLVEDGEWVPLPGMTRIHYREREELDRFIRRTNEWAPVLQRKDRRYVGELYSPSLHCFT